MCGLVLVEVGGGIDISVFNNQYFITLKYKHKATYLQFFDQKSVIHNMQRTKQPTMQRTIHLLKE